jgi:hypothetical protein
MKTIDKIKTYKVEFTTHFVGSRYINIVLEAKDEDQAKWVARNLCRFGFISDVRESGLDADYTEATHAFAYDKDYDVWG